MSITSRRQFIRQLGASAAALSPLGSVAFAPARAERGAAAQAGRGSAASFDLVIKGGHVIDPIQKISTVMDVAVKGDKIASVAANIPASDARGVLEASGKIVTAGLIDAHGHVYDGGITVSIDPDLVGIPRGVTTIV